ncbi:RNA polymerase sigma-70 factor [Chitinophaga oryzae]|uniref:RNA polymerase sigma-70 factor n=1 Tax=Chitinophaga oryzae TaxID=2725414 RepID=A0AAE7D8A4_9BACT|nr:RNA polymerase sigma-70 factor [Chitinophaga oryzae]QJB31893.1 RNA polymerase sigma-70 factor [Chitinophaga oryzae]QJB38371.1 RNA polymerase sigma-70 factor [Chitinophaga oryzae]
MPESRYHDESDLLLRVAAGDEHAYKFLFDRHWNRIYQVALSFLKDAEESREAVQLVFIRLWEKRSHLPGVENFDAWLFIMARNTILNKLNRKATEAMMLTDDLPLEDQLTPEMAIEYKQTALLVQEALTRLPPQQLQVFRLSREQGLTHAQIARQMNISQATVKSHIIRALHTLRAYIRERDGNMLLALWLLTRIID